MRVRERIPNFLDKLNEDILRRIFFNWFAENFDEAEVKILKQKRRIKKFWIANHDLRFAQVLILMGYIPNSAGTWYYQEDDEVLINAGIEPRDVYYWGQNYDKDMNRLPDTKWILIKNMTTEHIRAVIAFMGERLPERYKVTFQKELDLRKE